MENLNELSEEEALAILITTLKKRKKILNPLLVAKACRYLFELYGSIDRVAKRIEISSEMIREFICIDHLPEEVKDLIRQGLIQGIDIPYRLSRIDNSQRQIEVAKTIIGLNSHTVRDVVEYARRHPEKSAEECKQEVLKAKGTTIELHVIPIKLSETILKSLENKAKNENKRLEDLIKSRIEDKLKPKYTVSCDIKASTLILSLRKEDFEELNRKSEASDLPIGEFINKLLKE